MIISDISDIEADAYAYAETMPMLIGVGLSRTWNSTKPEDSGASVEKRIRQKFLSFLLWCLWVSYLMSRIWTPELIGPAYIIYIRIYVHIYYRFSFIILSKVICSIADEPYAFMAHESWASLNLYCHILMNKKCII